MANPYFNHVSNRIDPGSRALDSQINNIADEIAAGFDLLPTEAELFGGTAGFATSSGTANALLVQLAYTVSLADGFNFYVRFNATSTGAATINVNSTGVKTIVNSDGTPLSSGAMIIATIGHLVYDLDVDRYILISNNSAWGKPGQTEVQNPSEYCPGYTYTFVSGNVWRITGLDVSILFHVTRRLKFVDGANTYFGTVSSVVFTGGNTDMTMAMENEDSLTNSIGAVCLTTGNTSWSIISTDPFLGTSINDIVMGDIGATTYAFAVGQLGKCGVSTDGGLTWVMLPTGTTEHLNACAYDSINETFWAGGDAGVIISSINGTSIVLDTTSIPDIIGATGNDNIHGFSWVEAGLTLLFTANTTPRDSTAKSSNQGSTWTIKATHGTASGSDFPNLIAAGGPSNQEISGPVSASWTSGDTSNDKILAFDSNSFNGDASITPSIVSSWQGFTDLGAQRYMMGATDGRIRGNGVWTGVSVGGVTFGDRVRSFAYSPLHSRMVVVGDNAMLGYLEKDDASVNEMWTVVQNGFNPTSDINRVVWDGTHNIFIAVGSVGQIARSTNGTN